MAVTDPSPLPPAAADAPGLVQARLRGGRRLQALILQIVGYLDGRVDFWRQQKLMSERERDRKRMQEKWSHPQRSAPGQPGLYVLRSLEVIDAGDNISYSESYSGSEEAIPVMYIVLLSKVLLPLPHTPMAVSNMQGNNQHVRSS